MRRSRLLTFAVLFSIAAVRASSQSLAEVARQEEARRKDIKAPAKVLTNQDLSSAAEFAAPAPPPSGSTGSQPGSASSSSPSASDKIDTAGAADKQPAKDQKYWSARLKALQDALSRDQTYSDGLQSRVNALTRDFVNEADPAKQRGIAANRQKAIDELDRLKKQTADDKKALSDFDEEARRAGVPPGWLR